MSALDTVISSWIPLNSSLSADGNATDLSVAQRTYLTAQAAIAADADNQAQISLITLTSEVESPVNALRFRCVGATADTVCTYNIYTGTRKENPDCELSLLGTLSFTVGTQVSMGSGLEFADQLTVTGGSTSALFKNTTSAADERVAETYIDIQGDDTLCSVPTAVGSDCQLLAKAY